LPRRPLRGGGSRRCGIGAREWHRELGVISADVAVFVSRVLLPQSIESARLASRPAWFVYIVFAACIVGSIGAGQHAPVMNFAWAAVTAWLLFALLAVFRRIPSLLRRTLESASFDQGVLFVPSLHETKHPSLDGAASLLRSDRTRPRPLRL